MGEASVIALAFDYPCPDSLQRLEGEVRGLPVGGVRSELERFVSAVAGLSQGEWEELHTRTLDLSPLFVPYVGHVIWGENYRRGEFMADLKGAMREAGVDTGGELPDHLAPILRYVDVVDAPLADLVEVLAKAVHDMSKELKKAEPANPYRYLLAGARHLADEFEGATV